MNPCQENLTVTNHGQTDEFIYWDILQDQLPGFFMEEKSLGDWSRLKETKKKDTTKCNSWALNGSKTNKKVIKDITETTGEI